MSPRPHAVRALLVVLAVALGWRLLVCVRTEWAIDSDEAVIGRMAKHVATGRELPVWYYGQPYMGALEAYAAAPAVGLLGTTGVPLRLTALGFALVFVGASFALARRVLGLPAAVATGLYLALGPLVLTVWSLKLRGGYASLFALGALAFLLAHRIATDGATRRRSFALGLVAGLAAWLNLLAFPFLASVGLYLLSRRALRWPADLVIGFLFGSAPFTLANLASGGETFRFLLGRPGGGEGLATALGLHLPQLLGVIRPWENSVEPTWRLAIVVPFAAALGVFLWRERKSLVRFATLSREPTSGSELWVVQAAAFLGCAAFTSFGEDASSRYAAVLYVALAPALGAGFGALWERGRSARVAAAALLAGVLAFDAFTVLEHDVNEGDPGRAGAFKSFRGSTDLSQLYAELAARGVTAVAVDRWTGPRVVYETDERLVALPTRYPPDEARFRAARGLAWGVFRRGPDAERMTPLFERLDALGLGVERFEADGYAFFVFGDTGLGAERWSAAATAGLTGAERAFDRDPRSRATAAGTAALELDLGGEVALAAVAACFPLGERPEEVLVEVSTDGARWREVLRARGVPAAWRGELEGGPARARRVRLTGVVSRRRPWSVAEVFLVPPE